MNILTGNPAKIDRAEAARYAGYRGDGYDVKLFDECEKIILPALSLKACYAVFPVARGDGLDLGFTRTHSRDLEKNLSGCSRVALFVATAGAGVDRLIAGYSAVSPVRALIIGAMGSAAIESWCDEVNAVITRTYGATKPRFSCGYGDFPLETQRDIFRAMLPEKTLGVTLSEGLVMSPVKSVTAIVGIKDEPD